MQDSDNLVLHIVLPPSFALKSGERLGEETSFIVIGRLTPWYCSVDQVRLEGGIYLTKVPDLTLACQIWQTSKDAQAISYRVPPAPSPGTAETDFAFIRYRLFLHARQNYAAQRAAMDTVQKVFDLAGTRGSKTLANFSVTRMAFGRDEGLPKLLDALQKEVKQWEIVLKSGGELGPGGHVRPTMAAKGIFDISSAPPGRLWLTTGMGANRKTVAGFGSGQAPVKYGSPTFVNWRMGRFYGNYVTQFPKVIFT